MALLYRPTRVATAILIASIIYLAVRHASRKEEWTLSQWPQAQGSQWQTPQWQPSIPEPETKHDPPDDFQNNVHSNVPTDFLNELETEPSNENDALGLQDLPQTIPIATSAIRPEPAFGTEQAQPLPTSTELVVDAHKLSTTDSFWPHFKAVTKIPGITMAEAKAGCTWPALNEVNFQYDAQSEWVAQDRNDIELELRRQQWHSFIDNELIPYGPHQDRFAGRGIVIVAGNQKSMNRVRVILRALTKLGSTLPIEIHYWDDEMTEELQSEISLMWPQMYFNDLSKPTNIFKTNHDGPYINYQLKTAAVINSRFAEPLLLDSDNIPIIAPETLYESSTYQEYGTLFWPDIARTRSNNPIWAITNTECRMDEYEQESGQLIVDKRKFFYHLQLAAWFNNNYADYYNEFLLGDKDTFRFAWHALKTKYGSPPKWLTSVGTLTDDFYCGHSFAQHHPDGRVAFLHGGLIKTIAKEVMQWQRESRGGIFQVYKRSEHDEHHMINVKVSIKWDDAKYLPNRPPSVDVASCTDFYDVTPQPLDEIIPGFEQLYEELGGYWMLED
ncbi:putative glycosyltransferase family 71 protein [Phaeomoniella chlamydospora]|uniref:Putative glycosyltransferase family 71 protein n=1 Tax=Phaeomoniella chlamydospora TaxID=158046 RepID=A0A0G2DWB0_PHACM|nr:putative glycosyltransferase family 71 protein [Phaeomoniella chlamydospora]